MIALVCLTPLTAPLEAKDPPPDLVKRVAHRESEAAQERRQYAYTQSVRLQELDARGIQTGEYKEVREVIFSPTGERTERFSGEPVSRLKNLILTPEDFADIRNIQPFIITEDKLPLYEVKYKGEEPVDDRECWVLAVRPRQILSGQRLFDGMLWVKEDDFSVIRSAGKAVPEIVTTKQENLFPHFTTTRRLVNGFWFPSVTSADDTLYFRRAPIREKLTIRYDDYKKFGSESSVTFGNPEPGEKPETRK
ncbi:MAG TPA: hypothetical protein VHC72_20405 [Bryobacteraceae bacterium]|nr:hypothetical protein [Bryobacteraceae bacterium]